MKETQNTSGERHVLRKQYFEKKLEEERDDVLIAHMQS